MSPTVTQWTARIVPIDRAYLTWDEKGRQVTEQWSASDFGLQREKPWTVPIVVGHDEDLRVGQVDRLYDGDGWLNASFRFDDTRPGREVARLLKVGQEVSIGAKVYNLGPKKTVRIASLQEVSLVPRAAVPGAKVTDRREIPKPAEPATRIAPVEPKQAPKPPSAPRRIATATATRPAPVMRMRRPTHAEQGAELRRRWDWACDHGLDPEGVVKAFNLELGRASFHERIAAGF